MRGKFITFEGIDGAGKSTHLAWVGEWIKRAGHELVVTREPGGTGTGEAIRAMLLDPATQLHPDTETLLIFAARREHIARVIEPALARGVWVLCDRFTDATFAYQGGGRGLPMERIAQLEEWTQGSLRPDATFLFDLDADAGQARIRASRTGHDRFEREALEFHERVRATYRARAAQEPNRIKLIDSSHTIADIQVELEKELLTL